MSMQPFRTSFAPRPTSPINFGELPLPIFQAAVNECNINSKAPYGLAYFGAISALAIAIQRLFKVAKPISYHGTTKYDESPTSLITLGVAPSGDRKTTVLDAFMSAISDCEEKLRAKHQIDMEAYATEVAIWELRHGVLKNSFRKRIRDEMPDAEQEAAVKVHLALKPKKPKCINFMYKDTTTASLFEGLSECPTGSLVSSEGSEILNGPVFTEISKINSLWSGERVRIDRRNSPIRYLSDTRLTAAILTQPEELDLFIATKGTRARGSGQLARVLTFNVGSMQGWRQISVFDRRSYTALTKFNKRMSQLLDKTIESLSDENFKPTIVRFSPEAAEAWRNYFNHVETNILPGGIYEQIGDHASKKADNVARIAALFHVFEGFSGDISLNTLNAAILLGDKTTADFMQIFDEQTRESHNAADLDSWMDSCRRRGMRKVTRLWLRRHCPRPFRDYAVLDPLLYLLQQNGRIAFVCTGSAQEIDLSPWLHQETAI